DGDEERLARRGEDGVVVLVAAGAEGAAPEAERGVDGVLGLDEARERRGPGRELVGPARARRPRRHRDDEAAGAAEARHLGAVRRLPQRRGRDAPAAGRGHDEVRREGGGGDDDGEGAAVGGLEGVVVLEEAVRADAVADGEGAGGEAALEA